MKTKQAAALDTFLENPTEETLTALMEATDCHGKKLTCVAKQMCPSFFYMEAPPPHWPHREINWCSSCAISLSHFRFSLCSALQSPLFSDTDGLLESFRKSPGDIILALFKFRAQIEVYEEACAEATGGISDDCR